MPDWARGPRGGIADDRTPGRPVTVVGMRHERRRISCNAVKSYRPPLVGRVKKKTPRWGLSLNCRCRRRVAFSETADTAASRFRPRARSRRRRERAPDRSDRTSGAPSAGGTSISATILALRVQLQTGPGRSTYSFDTSPAARSSDTSARRRSRIANPSRCARSVSARGGG